MNDQLTMEEYQQLLQAGNQNQGLDTQIAQQQKMADMLRKGTQPGEGGMAGRVYVGPGIAGAISQVAHGYLAGKQQGRVNDLQAKKTENAGLQNQLMLRALLKGQPPAGSAPGQPVPQPMGVGLHPQAPGAYGNLQAGADGMNSMFGG